ncbi:hypothetical protein Tco_0784316 [Tanacetum coccineum]
MFQRSRRLVTINLELKFWWRSQRKQYITCCSCKSFRVRAEKDIIDQDGQPTTLSTDRHSETTIQVFSEAYEADQILLDTYGDTVTIKRPRDGADDDEEPSAGTDRGSKRRRSGKEPASTSAPSDTTTKTAGQTTSTGTRTHTRNMLANPSRRLVSKTTRLPSPDHAWNTSIPAVHESVQPWLSNLAQQDPRIRRDDALYKFKEGDLHRLRIQDIEDMLLLLVQGKVTNLSVEERIAFNCVLTLKTSHGPSDSYHNPSPATQSPERLCHKTHGDTLNSIDFSLELVDIEKNIRVNSFTMKMEILLEPTSNKLMVEHAEYDESNTYVLERFNTTAGNPVKKILLKLNLSDHRLCKMVVECQSVKVKEFQERCNIKAFQEWSFGHTVADSITERLKRATTYVLRQIDFSLLSRTASIRESGTSVLEDLKALSWKTCQEGSLLNLSDHSGFEKGLAIAFYEKIASSDMHNNNTEMQNGWVIRIIKGFENHPSTHLVFAEPELGKVELGEPGVD